MKHRMKRSKLQLGSLLMAMIMVVMVLPMNILADATHLQQTQTKTLTIPRYMDVPATHWASDVISKWSGNGYDVLQGDGLGSFFPDRGISLGELAVILTRTFGYTDKTDVEVTPAWATEYVQKAVSAGIIDKMDKIDANVLVTREQAIRYIALAYHIESVEGETTFSDNDNISALYKPYVNAFQRLGYVSGKGNNIFDPQAIYTRAEAMQVIENTTSDIVDNSKDGQAYDKNVIIRKPNVTLSNIKINGNLIIGQITGDIVLDKVTVNGKIIILGDANVIIGKDIESIIDEIDIVGDNVNLIVNKESIVRDVTIDANNVIISGDGTVRNVTVTKKSKSGVEVLTVPTRVTVDEKAGEVKTNNGVIKPGTTGKTSNPIRNRNNDRDEQDRDYDREPEIPQPKPPIDTDGVYSITNVTKSSSDSLIFELSNEKPAQLQVKVLSDVTGKSKDWESGTLLASERVSIPDKKEMESVEVAISSTLPQYFVVVANLVDEYGRNLCQPFLSIEFTDAYEQFQRKTVDDFEEEKVVQLDESNDNNFMVANDQVTKLESGEGGANHVTQSEENTYKFENINESISGLKVGDKIVVVSEDEDNIHLIKVAKIMIDGTSATIVAEDDIVLNDFFSYVKIELEKDVDRALIDMSESSPEVEYVPDSSMYASNYRMNARNSAYGINLIDVDISSEHGLSFKIEHETDLTEVTGEVSVKVELIVMMKYDFVLFGEDYFECKFVTDIENETAINFKFKLEDDEDGNPSEAHNKDYKIGRFRFPTGLAGLTATADLIIPVKLEASGTLSFTTVQTSEFGFVYNSNSKIQPVRKSSSTPTIDLTGKVLIASGPKFKAGVNFIKDVWIAEVSSFAGVEVEGTYKAIEIIINDNRDSINACDSCIDGKIDFFINIDMNSSAKINRWKMELFNMKFIEFRLRLADFFVSLKNDVESIHGGRATFGWGECPNLKYRTTFDPQDMDRKTMDDAEVSVRKSSTAEEVSSGKGRFSKYLYPGDYIASANMEGIVFIDRDFTVNKSAQVVVLSAQSGSNPGDGGSTPISGKCGPNLTWVLDVDTGLLTISGTGEMYDWDYDDESSEYIVPWLEDRDTIRKVIFGHGATNISIGSFRNCINLADVIIPNSITSIGFGVFDNCINLKSISLPNSVTEIEAAAFRNSGLTSIDIPYGVSTIEFVTFYNCKDLKSVTIPNSVINIDNSAFDSCIELTSIEIPNSVTTIKESAFQNCIRLNSVIIPDSVKSIGQGSFYDCIGIKTISIPSSVNDIGDYAFAYTGIESIEIPNSITEISEGLFSGCKDLIRVNIPSSVTTIGNGAFSFCEGLTSILIPDSVTNIGEQAFAWCDGLLNIELSRSIDNIAVETFMGCSNLSIITIPDGVIRIEDRAFDFSNLNSITIPKSVIYIGKEALGYGTINVYYEGSEDEWDEIDIVNWESIQYSIIVHYNSSGDSSEQELLDENLLIDEYLDEDIFAFKRFNRKIA